MDATKTQMKLSEWKKGILEVSMKKKMELATTLTNPRDQMEKWIENR